MTRRGSGCEEYLGLFPFVPNPSWLFSSLENETMLEHDLGSAY